MSAPAVAIEPVFRDLLAHWPQLFLIFTAGEDQRHHRTHVHQSPKNPDIFALVRIDSGRVLSISYITRVELKALANL